MLIPPLEVIASWPQPNYVDPKTHGPGLLVLDAILLLVVLFVVGLRYYTRLCITRSFGADDILIGLALIPTICLASIMIVTYAHSTWNRHIWDVEISTLTAIAKIQIAGELTYSLSSLLTKLSLSVFILRIIARSNRKMYERCIIYGMIAQCALTISFYFTVLLQCRPLRAYWDLEPSYPHICINQDYAMLTFGILNTTTDFFSFFIPMPMIWKLQLPLRQRLAVFSIFGLGCLVCLSAIARVYIDDLALRRTYDITWWVWPECLVTTLEIDIGVICASLPALRPLFARIWPRLLESVRSGKILWNSSPRGSEQGHSDISERDDQPEKVRNGDVVWKREYIVVNEPKDDIESNLSNVRV